MRRLSPLAWFTLVTAVVGVLFVAAFLFLPYDDAWGLGVLMSLSAVFLAVLAATVHARRHVLLVLAGVAATAFVAFGTAFLQLWGLAFAPIEISLTRIVDSHKSNLYFLIAAGSFVAMMGLLFIGAFWPRRRTPAAVQRLARAASQRTAAARQGMRPAQRTSAQRTSAQRTPAQRTSAPRQATPRPAQPRPTQQRQTQQRQTPQRPAGARQTQRPAPRQTPR